MRIQRHLFSALGLLSLGIGLIAAVKVGRTSSSSPPAGNPKAAGENRGPRTGVIHPAAGSARKPRTGDRLDRRRMEAELLALQSWELQGQGAGSSELLKSKREAVAMLAARWASIDPAAAMSWASTLEGENKEAILPGMALELASSAPGQAMAAALMLDEGKTRGDVLSFVSAQWAGDNPEEGLRWLRDLTDPALRTTVEHSMMMAVASGNPVGAASYMMELATPEARMESIPGIVQRWIQTDPEAAANWVRDIPDANLRAASLQSMLQVWAQSAPSQLQSWWTQQPAGTFRNEVAVSMSGIMAQTNRSSALFYAEGIDEPQLKTYALQRAAGH